MKYLIFIFLTVFSLFSCSKNSDNSSGTIQKTNDLISKWKLVKFEAGFGPTLNYNGEIQWAINANNTIDVFIANGTQIYNSMPLKIEGTYTFTSTTSTISFNQVGYRFEINKNVLIITGAFGPAADGIQLTFNKIQ